MIYGNHESTIHYQYYSQPHTAFLTSTADGPQKTRLESTLNQYIYIYIYIYIYEKA
jgi:hypothetical protein